MTMPSSSSEAERLQLLGPASGAGAKDTLAPDGPAISPAEVIQPDGERIRFEDGKPKPFPLHACYNPKDCHCDLGRLSEEKEFVRKLFAAKVDFTDTKHVFTAPKSLYVRRLTVNGQLVEIPPGQTVVIE